MFPIAITGMSFLSHDFSSGSCSVAYNEIFPVLISHRYCRDNEYFAHLSEVTDDFEHVISPMPIIKINLI